MTISYNWLKQFINIDWDAEKTAELLTDLGLEVEGKETFQSVKGGLEGVVIGKVLTCVQHPNADRLKLTTVDIGAKEPVQIVCGAPNVAAGQTVPVATIGTKLYTPEGEEWTIKKGKIRGEASHGMICAEDELSLGTSHDGIMVLDDDIKAGTPASEVFEVENDTIFEIGLTPNRSDAMSHFGVARDLKAGLLQQGINKELITPGTSAFSVDNRTLKIEVQVEDFKKAPRYCGVTISGFKVKESPDWLKNRLKAIGLSPINNVVDITNYVMHDLGQPLHAFDADKIEGQKVVVKTLPTGTKFITLDGVERTLHEDDLMICDAEKPMCIGGVFGGLHSGVSETTTQIFLESAYFDPISIRKTAKRHGLNTDASFRFERGIDPNLTEYALMRAAILIKEVAGGEITSDINDSYPNKIADNQVLLSFEKVTKIIGQEIEKETIKRILTSLDIKINSVTETGLGLTIPAYRNDVTREADVVEEILRVYGYNNIETTKKLNASIANGSIYDDHRIQNTIGNQLVAQGFNEIMTNSLTAATYESLTETVNNTAHVAMLNPLSQDLAVMRQNMLFTGLETISYNINRKNADLKLFEFGKTYTKSETYEEQKHLALYVTGNRQAESWIAVTQASDFFYLKGSVVAILNRLGISKFDEIPSEQDLFTEGLALTANNKPLVNFGVVSKSILKQFDIDQPVLYADFNWDVILKLVKRSKTSLTDIPKYPAVRRDFALLVDHSVTFKTLHDAAYKAERKLLHAVNLFDVYQGKNLPDGKKSYALSFILQDPNKTLTDKQIDKIMSKLQQTFEREFAAVLR
jgi:phenylalanyl-tRNA synthetase beta chain